MTSNWRRYIGGGAKQRQLWRKPPLTAGRMVSGQNGPSVISLPVGLSPVRLLNVTIITMIADTTTWDRLDKKASRIWSDFTPFNFRKSISPRIIISLLAVYVLVDLTMRDT